ncbi:MAG: FtsW/RodA/SpoVE family cell cycle protein [Microcoleus sp. PH2017_29_MFU_D_A]|uniref:FtsW/RodA/SpoVE family cell cycle protein n=1 Tax=unclassified Microcoleus TaxID=2642155 RepID=UPI001D374E48|nr:MULTISPECIES: FtsW/RodA/SpoVE family cell cycle protein [unclassified Microcoleus]MCC3465052.1 FtsW/RodA/SpoVE family cell cycle protein [Microcoleus sp. PH2017_06_SFM_O_A]TAE13085.1 MAG: FtsW/RodA/SpoVE family cell cycle protein [Oscillatoriales cyanobacterium]MCC3452187.1 FtsW/RodA/SpoVE family cell cycle protein [Microcoleus sp. PH2017_08_TRC_O_A]MCC3470804.1 FtsW/RodA/SpoVE family cell cycle protein [Microcoleus sp. PH2017_13_LAR_U_A]MCC3483324.1 FtsW/RodA/SpoVE family cell cycle protei
MTNDIRRFIPFFDPSASQWAAEARWLRWLTFLWLFVGLTALFSASYPIANSELGDGLYYFKRQLIAVAIGLAGFNLMVYSPLRYLMKTAQLGILVLLGVLWLTLIPGVGTTVNGATRWISLGPVPIIQPSELIKPFFVLQSARIFGNWPRLTNKVRFTWLLIFGAMLLGILLQPNLSTTALCGMTLWLVALAAGLPYLQLGATAIGGMLLAVLSISFKEYQRRRIMSFLNPWADAMQDGYQLVQSLLAVGSGGIWGVGLGMSQQKLFYLPIQYSDFIFAVFAEEFGLVGGFSLLLMLAAYATVALRVAMRARNAESQLVAIGVMVVMVGQSLLNIGVATGVLPTTGLPLPFFSYGGSSMVASLLLSGLLIRVARESSEAEVVSLDGRRGQPSKPKLRSTNGNTQAE